MQAGSGRANGICRGGHARGQARRASRRQRPARQRVAVHLKDLIRARELRVGAPLPSYGEMVAELGVSYVSVKRGVDDLVAEGVVRRENGRGSFVAAELRPLSRELDKIGVIFPASRESFFVASYVSAIMRGVARETAAKADTLIFSLRQGGLVNAAQLAAQNVGGVLLLGVENDDYLRAFASWGVPGVVADYCPAADVPLDAVACDNAAAARTMAARLAALGHRRVMYASPDSRKRVADPLDRQRTLFVRDSSDLRERREHSLRALREAGVTATDAGDPLPERDFRRHAETVLDQWQRLAPAVRPTAILADSDWSAEILLDKLRRRGIRVPDDVSLCAVAGDAEPGHRASHRIACCHFDFTGMGRRAAELLAARCERQGPQERQIVRIGFVFMEGATVKPVNTTRDNGRRT